MRRTIVLLAGLALLAMAAQPANALINLKFTPVHLVRQSKAICVFELKWTPGETELSVGEAKSLKGEVPKLPAALGFSDEDRVSSAFGDERAATAMLFVAMRKRDTANGDKLFGMVLVNTVWLGLYEADEGKFSLGADPVDLKAVWAGNTEMLQRAVAYVLAVPAAEVPTKVGARWSNESAVATVRGPVYGCAVVDLDHGPRPGLFVLADEGDRMFRCDEDGRTFQEITGDLQLTSRSKRAAWGDFDADGALDLASWDGNAVRFYLAGKGGKLQLSKA
ncbi:MAG: hypothetical protein ABR915_06260, partial [Thermoguttaceae bacterium]